MLNLYARYGFRPVARIAFDPQQAPVGIEKLGAPDVVFLVRDPDGVTGTPEVRDDYSEQQDRVPLVSYGKAVAIQERAVKAVISGRKTRCSPWREFQE